MDLKKVRLKAKQKAQMLAEAKATTMVLTRAPGLGLPSALKMEWQMALASGMLKVSMMDAKMVARKVQQKGMQLDYSKVAGKAPMMAVNLGLGCSKVVEKG